MWGNLAALWLSESAFLAVAAHSADELTNTEFAVFHLFNKTKPRRLLTHRILNLSPTWEKNQLFVPF